MNDKEVNEIMMKSRAFYDELVQLLVFPPFSIYDDKRESLGKYLDEFNLKMQFASDFFVQPPKNDEIAQDSKNDALRFLNEIKEILSKGDESLSMSLLNDVEEARLYQKRFNNVYEAFEEAKKNYGLEPDLELFI